MSYFGTSLYPAALPNQQAVISIVGNTTLGAGSATYDKHFMINGAGGYTITLPALDASNFPSKSYSIFNNSSATCTVNAAGADTVLLLGSSYSSISILPGERFLVQNMATSWIVALESASRTTTAPQFDNTIRTASTAFVQRALGNYQAFAVISSATTLTPAQSGSVFECSGTGYTITLPTPVGNQNVTYTLYNAGSNSTLTLSTPVGVIYTSVNGNATYQFTVGTTVQLVSDGVNWINLMGGSAAVLASPGYQKLPSGLIIQWGIASTVPSGGSQTITLPIAFPNAGLIAFATDTGSSGYAYGCAIASASSVVVYKSSANVGAAYFLAIGR